MRDVQQILADRGRTITPDQLIPLLQEVQEEQGFLSQDAMGAIATCLDIPVSKVFGTATFYNQFRFAKPGQHIIQICRGTACHVKGSASLADLLQKSLKLDAEGNSKDGRFTVVKVACLGACSIAPVMKIDTEFFGHLTAERVEQALKEVDHEQHV